MEKLNRVFERLFGMTYEDWHFTEFCEAERAYAHAKQFYRQNLAKRNKWKKAKYRYQLAMVILETYERFELLFSTN